MGETSLNTRLALPLFLAALTACARVDSPESGASLAIVDADIWTGDPDNPTPEAIREASIVTTIVDGDIVYQR